MFSLYPAPWLGRAAPGPEPVFYFCLEMWTSCGGWVQQKAFHKWKVRAPLKDEILHLCPNREQVAEMSAGTDSLRHIINGSLFPTETSRVLGEVMLSTSASPVAMHIHTEGGFGGHHKRWNKNYSKSLQSN